MTDFFIKYDNVEYPGFFLRPTNTHAAIVFIHGIGEHFGKYGRLVNYMAANGIAVYGIDLPGHGKSAGIRGQIGPRKYLHEIIDELIEAVSKVNPDIPLFLMGHSMGGNIVLSYRLDRENAKLAGVISSAPWLKLVNNDTFIYRAAARIVSFLAPNFTMNNGIKSEDLYTPSEQVAPRNDRDPLAHGLVAARTAADCFKWANLVIKNGSIARAPVYLMHGTGDKICSVEGSRAFAEASGSMCTYREWEGMQHELHNEVHWKEVADELIVWIGNRAKESEIDIQ